MARRHAKPQLQQHFILVFLSHSPQLPSEKWPGAKRVGGGAFSDARFYFLVRMRAKPEFRQHFISFFVTFTTTTFLEMTRRKKGGGGVTYVPVPVNPKQQPQNPTTLLVRRTPPPCNSGIIGI